MRIRKSWHVEARDPVLGVELHDVNGNGKSEILAYTKTGKLLIYDQTRQKLFEDVVSETSAIWTITLRDMDDDGQKELVMGGLDGLLRTFKYDSASNELIPMWAHQFGSSISGMVSADVNNDGVMNLIAYSLDKSIRVLHPKDGSLVWGQVFEEGIGDAVVRAKKDDGNMTSEVIACGNDGTIRAFDGRSGNLNWFKRFNNKQRCVCCLDSDHEMTIACGGDDKLLHFIDAESHDLIKTVEFEEYIWKCAAYPRDLNKKLLINAYSFDYLYEDFEQFKKSSKICCFNEKLNEEWELTELNVENMEIIENGKEFYSILSTTDGKVVLIDLEGGQILSSFTLGACTNKTKTAFNERLMVSCHDDGRIQAFEIHD